eukprot:scaffold19326_cov39-Attheya_sp.AAC.2
MRRAILGATQQQEKWQQASHTHRNSFTKPPTEAVLSHASHRSSGQTAASITTNSSVYSILVETELFGRSLSLALNGN